MWFGLCFFFQAEDGIRDLVRSRGLGDVYKRQASWSMRLRPSVLDQLDVDLKHMVCHAKKKRIIVFSRSQMMAKILSLIHI